MVEILKYYSFVNETNLTDEKAGCHLELNDIGKKLSPFSYYYERDMDDNNYFVFKSISYDDYQPLNNRVTQLIGSTYKDTEGLGRYFLNDVDFDQNDYFFYKIFSTRRGLRECHGVTIRYNDHPHRFDEQLTRDGKQHFVVIRKNAQITSVRLNSGGRSGSGDRAERIISSKFGMRLEKTKIEKKIITHEYNDDGIIPGPSKKAILKDILKTDMATIEKYESLFELSNIDDVMDKYDLVVVNGPHNDEKIEVKKYSATDLIYKRTLLPKDVMVAEQLKISNKSELKKLVELYKEMNPNANVEPLLRNYHIDKGDELSNYFNVGGAGQYRLLIDSIRNFYNTKIEMMKLKYDEIPNNKIMTNVFGIYFFNNENGIDGFLVRNNGNLTYRWKTVDKEWGLYRITLVVNVNPHAKRMVWLGDENLFVDTSEVCEFDKIPGKIVKKTKNKNIIIESSVGDIKWSPQKGYWLRKTS